MKPSFEAFVNPSDGVHIGFGIRGVQRLGRAGIRRFHPRGGHQKQPLPGIGLHDPLHGWQACPEFIAFDQEVGQYVPGCGYLRAVSSQNRDQFVTSPPPPNRYSESPSESVRGT